MRIELKDFLPGLCGAGFGAWLLRETYVMDLTAPHKIGGGMSAAGYPRVLAFSVLALSVILLVRAFARGDGKQSVMDQAVQAAKRSARRKVALTFLSLVAYTLLLYQVGYLIMTILLLAFIMVLVGERRWVFVALSSLSLTLTLYGISFYVFHIDLPAGVLKYLTY